MLRFVLVTTLVSLLTVPYPSLAQKEGASGTREFFSTNKDGRIRVKVQLWGSVDVKGTHYVPDNYTLIDLLGVAGGPVGELSRSSFLIRRTSDQEGKTLAKADIIEFSGEDLIKNEKISAMTVRSNDIIYFETQPSSSENLMRNLTLVSTITGIISSLLLTYFIIQDRNRD